MSVTAPEGFEASGIRAGIKASGDPDLALVRAVDGLVPSAAVFTTNRAAAAPVVVSREHLALSNSRSAAVILNSGCANAATGRTGDEAARRMARAVGSRIGVPEEAVLVCSTGLIGTRLPIEAIESSADELVAGLGSDDEDARRAATAILTTDTHPKEVVVEFGSFRIGGMVKGAGMIAPNLATMLAVLTTDVAASPEELASSLGKAVEDSFNSLTIDGCTSTNDTVVLLASGRGGRVRRELFDDALGSACTQLAAMLAEDAEGATRVAKIVVSGAASADDARRAARRVAQSLLVKTSLYGADPYWGRIVSELGSSGAAFDLERTSLSYGSTPVLIAGNEVEHDRLAVSEYLHGDEIEIFCDLGIDTASARMLTTDLGHGYIDENMTTS